MTHESQPISLKSMYIERREQGRDLLWILLLFFFKLSSEAERWTRLSDISFLIVDDACVSSELNCLSLSSVHLDSSTHVVASDDVQVKSKQLCRI